MKNLKIIIGLGNPITKYKNTRHNAGIWYLHMLSKIYNKKFKKINKFNGYVSEILFFNKKVFLFVPDVYMNLNFLPIYKISSFYNITLNEMLIIHDELDLQPGVIKLKNGYGSNGHKGLKGIIQKFKKKIFINVYRLELVVQIMFMKYLIMFYLNQHHMNGKKFFKQLKNQFCLFFFSYSIKYFCIYINIIFLFLFKIFREKYEFKMRNNWFTKCRKIYYFQSLNKFVSSFFEFPFLYY